VFVRKKAALMAAFFCSDFNKKALFAFIPALKYLNFSFPFFLLVPFLFSN